MGGVRRAEEEDLDRVMEIEREAFPDPRPLSSFRFQLGREGFLVYEERGEVVGYIVIAIEDSPWWMLTAFAHEKEGHILDLAVAPERWGEGIGETLLRRGLKFLKERRVDSVKLEVRVGNEPAIDLYERLGFEQGRVLSSYYSDGDDAILMRRKLDE